MTVAKWLYYIGGTIVFVWWLATFETAIHWMPALKGLPQVPNWLVVVLILLDVWFVVVKLRANRQQRQAASVPSRDGVRERPPA